MINTTDAQRDAIVSSITKNTHLHDEKVWTCLLANLVDNSPDKNNYISKLLGFKTNVGKNLDLWFEAQPIPPRVSKRKSGEGNTKLDLSFGDIKERKNTASGIEFKRVNDWVCFVEAKLLSDCSASVSYDPFRNQIARVIENLVTFQCGKKFPKKTIFTLLTPKIFMDKPFTKLYGYKFFEYMDRDNIEREFNICKIERRNYNEENYCSECKTNLDNEKNGSNDWQYPINIKERLAALHLNWISFEDILEPLLGLKNLNVAEPSETDWKILNSEFNSLKETLIKAKN